MKCFRFSKLHADVVKDPKNVQLLEMFREFCKRYPVLYDIKTGRINKSEIEFMQKLRDAFGEESNLGKMARERITMTLRGQK